MSQATAPARTRIEALDYLRGFFIAVIVIDHLWKFPSMWMFVTGEAKLWMTAAEGFVIISGFLIGYIRGYKGLKLPFVAIAKKLLSRGLLLYLWMIIATLGYAAISWYVPSIPNVPSPPQQLGDWSTLIHDTLTMQTPSLWIFFLAYYAIFLILAMPFIWLLRHRFWQLALSASVVLYGIGYSVNEDWMKWQIIFFVPALAGYYYPSLVAWWNQLTAMRRKAYRATVLLSSGILLIASAVCTFVPIIETTVAAQSLNRLFDHDTFGPARVVLSFLWFVALINLFDALLPWLKQRWGIVLHYFGTHSLTAYICHGLAICLINYTIARFALPQDFLSNTIYGALGIFLVYWFIRLPIVAKIVPR